MPTDQGHGPARRGRKDPALLEEIGMDMNEAAAAEGEDQPVDVFLVDGDIVTCKITREVEIVPKHSDFYSYGITTRAQPGESEEDVFLRLANPVWQRVNQLVEVAEEEYAAEVEARRNAPINPRR